MKTQLFRIANYSKLLLFILFLVTPILSVEAQRFGHGASMNRAGTSRASTGKQTINGGFHKQPSRAVPSTKSSTVKPRVSSSSTRPAVTRPSTGNASSRPNVNRSNNNSRSNRSGNLSNSRVVNRPTNNNVNINVNHNNNIHINNNRHTVVRPSPRPYHRPPYAYGGFFYYSYHPYYYHPYRPFYWGPVWHPWGFFVASLATTAIVISVENQQYHYDEGNYYVQEKEGYTVVQAPVGATIKVLPDGYEVVDTGDTVNNYYYGGVYYEKSNDGYTVVPPTAGTIVENLPEGGEEVRIGDQTYVKYGETYYQPVQVDGKNQYEVVEVKQE